MYLGWCSKESQIINLLRYFGTRTLKRYRYFNRWK